MSDVVDWKEILNLFKAMPGQILLTSDAAIKDAELPAVQLVVHLSLPTFDQYLQRIACLAAPSSVSSRRPREMTTMSLVLYAGHQQQKLRALERELQRSFVRLERPDEELLRRSAVAAIASELRLATQQYDTMAFEADAAQQLELHGPRLLAAALVLLERRRQGEEWLSVLSGRPRYTPLLLADPHLEKLRSRQSVLKAVQKAFGHQQRGRPEAQIGRIELSRKGWLVDVPRAALPSLLEEGALQGVPVVPISELPDLMEERLPPRATRRRAGRRKRAVGSLAARARRQRQEFLYPAGRRTLFGEFLRPGQRSAKPLESRESKEPC
eukprot:g976.t1